MEEKMKGQFKKTIYIYSYQFKFVKHLYKGLRNKLVESGQEAIDLRLDGAGHPELRHQLDILCLEQRRRIKEIQNCVNTCINTKIFIFQNKDCENLTIKAEE